MARRFRFHAVCFLDAVFHALSHFVAFWGSCLALSVWILLGHGEVAPICGFAFFFLLFVGVAFVANKLSRNERLCSERLKRGNHGKNENKIKEASVSILFSS